VSGAAAGAGLSFQGSLVKLAILLSSTIKYTAALGESTGNGSTDFEAQDGTSGLAGEEFVFNGWMTYQQAQSAVTISEFFQRDQTSLSSNIR
jgi:hypothetical protein